MSDFKVGCPYCKDKEHLFLVPSQSNGGARHRVFCPNCDITGPAYLTVEQAVAEWENRSETGVALPSPSNHMPSHDLTLWEQALESADSHDYSGRGHVVTMIHQRIAQILAIL